MKRSPLDFDAGSRIGAVRAARIFSNVISPPVMFAGLGFALGILSINDIEVPAPRNINICQIAIATQLQIVENHTSHREKSPVLKGFFSGNPVRVASA